MNWAKKHKMLSLALFLLLGISLFYLTIPITVTCEQCSAISQSATEVNFAELVANPEKYRGQTIRVKAIFDHDAGYTFLRNSNEADWKQVMPAGFGANFIDYPTIKRSLAFNTGLNTWYDGSVLIKAIGVYGAIDDQRKFQQGQNGLTLLCIEKVNPSSDSVPINLFRYTISLVGKIRKMSLTYQKD